MIDFHNHIIPGIDDGAKNLKMSLNMLLNASKQGITDVVNTVHYQHPKVEGKEITFNNVKDKIDNLQKELNKNKIPINLHIGAEVFFLPNLIEICKDPITTFADGKYMLIEFNTLSLPKRYRETLFELKMFGVTPIIAHPERYREVQNNVNLIAEWLESGCIIQLDAGSPIGLLGKDAKKTSIEILKNQWCQLIGSDAHNDNNRDFCLKQSLDFITNLVDYDVRHLVVDNPRKILDGEPIEIDINYDFSLKNHSFLTRFKRKMNIT